MRNPLVSLAKRVNRLRGFPALGKRDGATFLLDPKNWIDNRLLSGAAYETAQLAFARRQVEERGLDHVLDIGANFGLYSILLGRLASVKRVVAFEPVQRNFNQLSANIFANRLDDRVTAMRCALGAQDAELTIHIDPTSTGVSRLDLEDAGRDTAVFSQTETVEVRRLDDIIGDDFNGAFVKIDVEGQALAVLEGAPRFLAQAHGVIQMEVSGSEAQAVHRLEAAGWRAFHQIDSDHYFVRDQA